ncbi:MAG: prepilin-type N-terminal cleavage/methylation domain-containing protein [Nitrospirae bacterium]|nr:prepilin-type N-terminal cleavage/methylation domain-containing protein [Nitrospirota bacterium]
MKINTKKHTVSSTKQSCISCQGFTLIELLIVIAILATLLGIALPLLSSYIDKAKIARAQTEIRMIEKDIIAFFIEKNRYPKSLAEIGLGNFKDPYDNTYQYLLIATDQATDAQKTKQEKTATSILSILTLIYTAWEKTAKARLHLQQRLVRMTL